MDSLSLLEAQVFNGSLANKIMDRLAPVEIVLLEKQYEDAFYNLNMAWLERYFPNQIEDEDRALLTDPQSNIVTLGGVVWVALGGTQAKSVIGTVAFLPQNELAINGANVGRVLKLSVAEHAQGKGVAQRLLSTVIDFAKSAGFSILTLETASYLKSARQLYDKNAFIEMASPNKSHYQRADVYMEKQLRDAL
jgi:GNAT superfamily N-acetyltransferase